MDDSDLRQAVVNALLRYDELEILVPADFTHAMWELRLELSASNASTVTSEVWPKFCPGCMAEFHRDGTVTLTP